MYFILGIVVFLLITVLWIVGMYNQLARAQSMVQEAWSGIDVQLKRRYDLIPNLVDTVKGSSVHEKSIIENIVRMRAASMGATGIAEKQSAELGLSASLKSLFALAEQYPNLKANENFLSLQKELSSVEHEVQLARRYYNGAVRDYAVLIRQFPSNCIARTFGFVPAAYFEINEPGERSVPSTKF